MVALRYPHHDVSGVEIWTSAFPWANYDPVILSYIAAAVNNFFPSVVSTLGYSRNITYCLTARE